MFPRKRMIYSCNTWIHPMPSFVCDIIKVCFFSRKSK
nr:MAG TPA: hypothetical protein [Caudoviricetes sp.]